MAWTIERKHDHVAVVTMNTNKVNAQNDLRVFAARSRRGSSVGRTRGCSGAFMENSLSAERIGADDGGSASAT